MKNKNLFYAFISMSIFFIFTHSCKEELVIPTLTTVEISEMTSTTAKCGGSITSNGGAEIVSRGVCWSINQNPTITDNKSTSSEVTSNFSCSITNLVIGTKYYVRAFATNSVGTGYGNQVTVTTMAALPNLTTTAVSAVTSTNATSGGNISNDGGGTITGRGVCWSTTELPTIEDNKTNDGTGKGTFTSSITGLIQGTTYYLRAYATNSSGTSYGNQVTFKTLSIPTVTTSIAISITETSATSGGNVVEDGGLSILSRGVCWNTTTNPTISNNFTSNGTSVGTFTSNLTGLSAGTTYYLRAFATNSLGTGYGNEISFTTNQPSSGTITDIDGNVYHFLTIGSQVWLVENLKTTKYRDGTAIPLVTAASSWSSLTTPAYCWYNNDETTNKNVYGALYNWYAVNTGKLAPTGWHVASNDDWQTLIDFLGGLSIAGGKMKETGTSHWTSPNTSATNSFGFTALPGGMRYQSYTTWVFSDITNSGYWWSSSYLLTRSAIKISYDNSSLYNIIPGYGTNEKCGMSVRCVRN